MNGLSYEKISKITEIITQFVLLNVMWILGTLMGGVIFGWAPSCVAVFSIVRDMLMKREKDGLLKEFWSIYKKEFIKSNKLGLICMILFVITLINKYNFANQQETLFKILVLLSNLSEVLIFGCILYMFPLYVHYDIDLKSCFMTALSLLICKPLVTLFIILWSILITIILSKIPGIIVVGGISAYFYGVMAINYQFFMRNEQRIQNQKQNIAQNNKYTEKRI